MQTKRRIRDRKGVQEGVLDILYDFKEKHESNQFQISLSGIAEQFNRDPKPSSSTILRAALDLSKIGKIGMEKDPTNPRGPYTFTVIGYRPRALRIAAPSSNGHSETPTAPQTQDVVAIVSQIASARARLQAELAEVERQYEAILGVVSKLQVQPQTKRAYVKRKEATAVAS